MKCQLILLAALANFVAKVCALSIFSLDDSYEISERVNIVFTRNMEEVVYLPLYDLPFLITHRTFDRTLPTAVYVHGWLESGVFDLSTLAVREAYINRDDHNVITVDWSYYSKDINYPKLIPQLMVIAETIAEYILMLVYRGCDIQKLHLVGHSLGGQMVGKIGRHVKKLSHGKVVIPKIIALDPARPGFETANMFGVETINKNDGDFVQIIHSNGGVLGMKHHVGHVGFFPDGGTTHPGCDIDAAASVFSSIGIFCDHFRSWHFYQLTVRDPETFPAVKCDSWEAFLAEENCNYDDIEYMGFGANAKATGKYFMQTNPNIFNLSRGLDGLHPTNVKTTRLLPFTKRKLRKNKARQNFSGTP